MIHFFPILMLREQSWGLLLCSNYCNKPMMTTSTTEENHLRDAWQRTFSTHRCTIHVLKSHLDIFPMRYDMISSKVVHFMLFMGGKCVFLLFQNAFSPFVNHHKHLKCAARRNRREQLLGVDNYGESLRHCI